MRVSLSPLVLPPAVFGAFAWGIHWLMTHPYDRGFAWSVVIGSALVGTIAIALHVYTVDNRLRDLEERIDSLRESSREKDA